MHGRVSVCLPVVSLGCRDRARSTSKDLIITICSREFPGTALGT